MTPGKVCCQKNRKPCVLYLHDVYRPTIPGFDSHAPKIFVLLKESKESLISTQAYSGMTYPPEIHPYKNTPLPSRLRVSPSTYTFQSHDATENHLELDESQRNYAPLLSGLKDMERAKLLAETREKLVPDLRKKIIRQLP